MVIRLSCCHGAYIQVILILFKMAPKHNSDNVGSLDMPKRGCKVFPRSERYFDRERASKHIHVTFTTVYCYNCSILLLVTVNH